MLFNNGNKRDNAGLASGEDGELTISFTVSNLADVRAALSGRKVPDETLQELLSVLWDAGAIFRFAHHFTANTVWDDHFFGDSAQRLVGEDYVYVRIEAKDARRAFEFMHGVFKYTFDLSLPLVWLAAMFDAFVTVTFDTNPSLEDDDDWDEDLLEAFLDDDDLDQMSDEELEAQTYWAHILTKDAPR